MKRKTLINLVIAAAVGFAVLAGFRAIVSYQGSFEFEAGPIDGLRTISGGKVSTAFSPLAGVSAGSSRYPKPPPENLCYALFKEDSWPSDLGVPVASFSDYNCPYCRVQTIELSELMETSSNPFVVTWHELALLGESSVLAARAALAADRQGAYVDFQRRLMQTPFSPTPAHLRELAESIGIRGDRLMADMQDPRILSTVQRTQDLSKHLRFIGTPGLVVGRTVVTGYMPIDRIEELIELESDLGVPAFCR